jgi:HEAT repeat protein
MTAPSFDADALRMAIGSGDPSRSMPALAALRHLDSEQAVPLLLLGLQQEAFMVRSLSCAGLGYKPTEEGWQALVRALQDDIDANVRAEAANALVSHSLERAWPLLLQAFGIDDRWLVRCSILSAVAEHPGMAAADLLTLARLAIADADGTVRVGGAEVLGRLRLEGVEPWAGEARQELARLQQDGDHRVVAAALNGLSS